MVPEDQECVPQLKWACVMLLLDVSMAVDASLGVGLMTTRNGDLSMEGCGHGRRCHPWKWALGQRWSGQSRKVWVCLATGEVDLGCR